MSPNALKDEAFWGSVAEILREIGPSDEELDAIRKELRARLNLVQPTYRPKGSLGPSDH